MNLSYVVLFFEKSNFVVTLIQLTEHNKWILLNRSNSISDD